MLISVLGEPDVTIIGPDPMVDVSQIYLPSVISVSKKLHILHAFRPGADAEA